MAKEFNTIAVDDGIAMGHGGMLYSLPSRELIADAVEYMVNAHCADALVCISNCDKITPGMLMAAMRLNIPAVFVSGGPMEAGKTRLAGDEVKVDLISAMMTAGDEAVSDEDVAEIERSACPTCGSCSGMFTANSMNCLTEALGLSLPGNGTVVATHTDRERLFLQAGRTVVDLAKRYYEKDDDSVLPRSVCTKAAFDNAMALDIAMGGCTNTVLHILAAASEAELDFTMADIDALSRRVPNICKVAPSIEKYHVEDVHRAGGIMGILGELDRGGLIDTSLPTVHTETLAAALAEWDIMAPTATSAAKEFFLAGPAGIRTDKAFSQSTRWPSLDTDRSTGCIRDIEHAYSADGGLAILYGNLAADGCIVKTAGVDESILHVHRARAGVREPGGRGRRDPGRPGAGGRRGDRPLRGAQGRPGHAGDALPDHLHQVTGAGQGLCPAHRRSVLGGYVGSLDRARVARGGRGWGSSRSSRTATTIAIDIPNRSIELVVDDAELERRRDHQAARADQAYTPVARERVVSQALLAYAALTTSAARGAVRDLSQLS